MLTPHALSTTKDSSSDRLDERSQKVMVSDKTLAVDTFILHLASLGLVKTTVADTQKFPSEKACVFPKTNFKMKVGQNSNVTHPEVHCPVSAPLCFEPQSRKTLGVCFGAWCRRHFFLTVFNISFNTQSFGISKFLFVTANSFFRIKSQWDLFLLLNNFVP